MTAGCRPSLPPDLIRGAASELSRARQLEVAGVLAGDELVAAMLVEGIITRAMRAPDCPAPPLSISLCAGPRKWQPPAAPSRDARRPASRRVRALRRLVILRNAFAAADALPLLALLLRVLAAGEPAEAVADRRALRQALRVTAAVVASDRLRR